MIVQKSCCQSRFVDFWSWLKFLGLKLNLFLVNRSGFDNLLQDDVFVDYLNKFMALPVFGQRMIYRKKQDKAGLNGQTQFVRWFVC